MHEFESGFFVKEPAWHRLGTTVSGVSNTLEGIKLAGLDWDVIERPVYTTMETPEELVFDQSGVTGWEVERAQTQKTIIERVALPGWKALMRSTDKMNLSIVRDRYTPLQNREAFAFLDPFIQDGDAVLESAGSLRKGKVIWVLARLKQDVQRVGFGTDEDTVAPYLLISNAHDGTQAVRVFYTFIRVVCANTLAAAFAGNQNGVSIVHGRSVADALRRVRDTVKIGTGTFETSIEQFRAMRRRGVTSDSLRTYIKAVVGNDTRDLEALIAAATKAQDYVEVNKLQEEKDKEPRAVQQIIDGFNTWIGQKEAGDNLWGAYNAVTYWLEHERGRSADTRLHSSWFGTSKGLRQKAHDEAMKVLASGW